MSKPYENYCLEWAVEDWCDTNIKILGRDSWISEFEDTVYGKSRYLQKQFLIYLLQESITGIHMT